MLDKPEYLARIRAAIQEAYKCQAHYLRTELVHETSRGQTVWLGEVEIFALTGHPTAKHCYAWSNRPGDGDRDKHLNTMLEIPPIDSPRTAVKAAIVAVQKTGG